MSISCIQNANLEDTGFHYTMSLIQGKYKMVILYTLMEFKVVRFNELKKYIRSISYKTLSSTLKELEADGLVHVLPVAALVHLRAAVAVALSHAVVEAGPLLADVPGEFFPALGQAQGGQDGLDDVLGGAPAPIGAEVPGPVLRRPVGQ